MPTAIINGKKVVVPKGHEAVEIDGVMTIVSAAEASRRRKVSVAAGGAAVSRRDLRTNAEKANDAGLEKLADSEFRETCKFYRVSAVDGVNVTLRGKMSHVNIDSDFLKDGRKIALKSLVPGAIVAVKSNGIIVKSSQMFMGEKFEYDTLVGYDYLVCVVPEERAVEWGFSE